VGEAGNAPGDESLVQALGRRTGLLVLDNCEHLLDESADIALRIIQACQGIRILATSRHALGVIGETCWPIEPLETPDSSAAPLTNTASSVDDVVAGLMSYAAVQLFVQQARSVQPAFRMTEDNAVAVAQICTQLDGIPLAIELAAAWAKALTIERISRGLADRFEFLSGSVRARLPHHQTLRAMIDWSYQLLQERERTLLHRLSVFSGGWTLELAEKICADDLPPGSNSGGKATIRASHMLMLMTGLVEQSLVQVDLSGSEARYSMLETIRQYAAERLEEAGETEALRQRHAMRYTEFAEVLSEQARGPRQQECLQQFEIEHDNFRAALLWAVEHEAAPDMALRLCGALLNLWVYRSYYREGLMWSERALARLSEGDRSPLRAQGLAAVGTLNWMLGNLQGAYELHLEALTLRREHGDLNAVAVSAERTGVVLMNTGNYADARQYLSEAIEIGRATGNKAVLCMALINRGCADYGMDQLDDACEAWQEALSVTRPLGNKSWTAVVLGNLGDVAARQGDFVTARATYDESLHIFKEIGDKGGIAIITHNLGVLADAEKRYEDAWRLISEALTGWWEWGNSPHMVQATESLAFLSLSEAADGRIPSEVAGRYAARLLGAVECAREKLECAVPAEARIQYPRKLAQLKAMLGEEQMRLFHAEGRGLTLEEMAAEALAGAGS
jgi:non-specific serine/threonine protein kinase